MTSSSGRRPSSPAWAHGPANRSISTASIASGRAAPPATVTGSAAGQPGLCAPQRSARPEWPPPRSRRTPPPLRSSGHRSAIRAARLDLPSRPCPCSSTPARSPDRNARSACCSSGRRPTNISAVATGTCCLRSRNVLVPWVAVTSDRFRLPATSGPPPAGPSHNRARCQSARTCGSCDSSSTRRASPTATARSARSARPRYSRSANAVADRSPTEPSQPITAGHPGRHQRRRQRMRHQPARRRRAGLALAAIPRRQMTRTHPPRSRSGTPKRTTAAAPP